MADNFNMKQFLTENKLGPYAKLKEEKSNKQKLIDAGYSESDAEDFADEFEQGGSKVPQKVKDILDNKKSENIEEDNAIYNDEEEADEDAWKDYYRGAAPRPKGKSPRAMTYNQAKDAALWAGLDRIFGYFHYKIVKDDEIKNDQGYINILKSIAKKKGRSLRPDQEQALRDYWKDNNKNRSTSTNIPTRQLTGDPEVDFLGEGLSAEVIDRIEGAVNEKMLQTALMALGEVITDLENEGIDYDDALAYVQSAVKDYLGAF